MSGNSFGTLFKITTWGESHGKAIGVIIDGCPAGIKISTKDIQNELNRRKPGQSSITTSRNESDIIEIMSGIFEGKTTGTPISLIVFNKDHKSCDYKDVMQKYRPSHADLTYDIKYGFRDYRGGGRASARETLARVAAGAIAKKILMSNGRKIEILAYTKQIHKIEANVKLNKLTSKQIESNNVRCPDLHTAKKMINLIEKTKKSGDSVGGIIECVIKNVPTGLGSPVFDKLEAKIAHAMLSIPAVKGFEIGSGFTAIKMKGSDHNDPIQKKRGKIITISNNAGGIVGGISNGMDIVFRVAFKPTATIFKKQKTISKDGRNTTIQMSGRHDPCVVPRAVPIVEAMAALVLIDEYLIQKITKA